MNIKTFSYRFAKEILEHPNYKSIYDELINICKECPLPIYIGKSKNQRKLDVVQQVINSYFMLAFTTYGWDSENHVSPINYEDSLRSDFRKTFNLPNGNSISVQIEVEMGNSASSYRNYFKFQLAFSHGLADLCVLILPTDTLSRRIDSGVASYEKTLREIPSAKLSVTVPTFVIGLDDLNYIGVDVKAISNKNLPLLKAKGNNDHYDLVKLIINESLKLNRHIN